VAAFPYANVNLPVNAFFAAPSRSIQTSRRLDLHPELVRSAKGKESALAQSPRVRTSSSPNASALRRLHGKDRVLHRLFVDQNSIAPKVIPVSVLALWDPDTKFVIDAWWDTPLRYGVQCADEAHHL